MRISYFLLLIASVAAADPLDDVSFSGDCSWIYVRPPESKYMQTVNGQGFRIEPALEAKFFEHLSLRTHAGYQWSGWGATSTSQASSFFGMSSPGTQIDSTYSLQTLSFGAAFQLEFLSTRRLFLSMGFSLETPLQANYTVESWVIPMSGAKTKQPPVEGSFGNGLELRYFDFKVGGKVWRSLGLMAGYRLPIQTDKSPMLQQIELGVRWRP